MTVYIVTSGEYSDYHIDAVFSNKLQANLYTLAHPESRVEEYEMDGVVLDNDNKILRVQYKWWRYCCGCCGEGERCSQIIDAHISDDMRNQTTVDEHYFTFYTEMPTRLVEDIKDNGKDSPLLKKIAEDEFAKYLYDRSMTAEMLHKKFVYAREKEEERERARREAAARKVQERREQSLEKVVGNSILHEAFEKSDITASFDCPVLTVSGLNKSERDEMMSHVGVDRFHSFMQAIREHSEDGYNVVNLATGKYKVKSIKIGDSTVELTFSGWEV